MYDKIEDTENQLVAARAKKMAIEAEKLTGDNIYKVLIYFDKLYSVMDDQEKRQLMESLLSEVQIYEERQPNGQWLKSIKFKLPIIAEDMSLSLDNDAHIETVCRLVLRNPVTHINIDVDVEEMVQDKRGLATYGQIKASSDAPASAAAAVSAAPDDAAARSLSPAHSAADRTARASRSPACPADYPATALGGCGSTSPSAYFG